MKQGSPYVLPDPGGRLEVGSGGRLYETLGGTREMSYGRMYQSTSGTEGGCQCQNGHKATGDFVGSAAGLLFVGGLLWLAFKVAPGQKK